MLLCTEKRGQDSFVLLLAILMLARGAGAQTLSDQQRFAEGLRQQRQFEQAESYCRQQLSSGSLPERARAELTLELIRSCAELAADTPPEDREPVWQRARQAAVEFQRRSPDHPRGILVRMQDALTLVVRGELHRQEAELLVDAASALEAARSALREAARSLEQLDAELTREIPLRHREKPKGDELSAAELIRLQNQLHYQLARVYRNRALCYPADSDDRVAALTAAVEQLNKPLLAITARDPLIWPIRLDLAVCFRLLGQASEAEQILREIADSDALAAIRLEARAERARLELDRRRPREALAIFAEARQIAGQGSAELEYAYLETCLALWRSAASDGDDAQANTWRDRAVQTAAALETAFGPYWGRRGDLLLVRTIGRSHAGGDVQLLTRAADDLYRRSQWSEAVAAYEQAGEAAQTAGDAQTAFQLRYKAALVCQQRGEHGEAQMRLRRLALDLPAQPEAAQAHLLAAWNAAQAVRSDPSLLDDYAKVLDEHLAQWPAGTTADTARIWLARVLESRQQWRPAAEAFQAVSRQHPEHEQAFRDAARCWSQAVQRAGGEGEAAGLARAAADAFARLTPAAGETQKPWTPLDRFCAVQAATWLIDSTPDGYAQAERVLASALDGTPLPDPVWTTQAQTLLIIALAGQPTRRSLAEQRLQRARIETPSQLFRILEGLAQILASQEHRAGDPLTRLQRQVAQGLWERRDQLPAERLPRLERLRAQALLSAGGGQAALEAYAQLAQRYPDDGEIQRTHAQLLLDGTDRRSWEQALQAWRKIAARSRPATDDWYQARYAIAAALIRLGQHSEAAARIRYLQALPPGLQNTLWAARFQQLLEQCEDHGTSNSD